MQAAMVSIAISDAPTRYTSCVYHISHNMCARHTHYPSSARRTYCADYLQSDARGGVLTPDLMVVKTPRMPSRSRSPTPLGALHTDIYLRHRIDTVAHKMVTP